MAGWMTGLASGRANLRGKLVQFASNKDASGNFALAAPDRWTHENAPSSDEDIIKSVGVDGDQNAIVSIRIEDPTAATSHDRTKGSEENGYDNITISGAQRRSGGTLFNTYGKVGPFLFLGPNATDNNLGGAVVGQLELNRPQKLSFHENLILPDTILNDAGTNYFGFCYDGKRRVYYAGSDSGTIYWYFYDIPTGEKVNLGGTPGNLQPVGYSVFVSSKEDDVDYIYVVFSTTALNSVRRYNTKTGAWQTVTGTPATGPGWSTPNSALGCYDGFSKVYFLVGGGGPNNFAVYDITADTWTTLADPSFSTSASMNKLGLFFVPKHVFTGATSDAVLFIDTSTTQLRRYDTGFDVFNGLTPGGAAFSNVIAQPSVDFFSTSYQTSLWSLYDSGKYVYVGNSYQSFNNKTVYRLDLSNIGGGWLSVDQQTQNSSKGRRAKFSEYLNPFVAKVRANPTDPTPFWMFGTKDRIVCATRCGGAGGNAHYRFAYFGRMKTYHERPSQALTQNVSAANPAKMYVADNVEFQVGEKVLITATDAENTEKFTVVTAGNDGNDFVEGRIVNAYTLNNARIGVDPYPTVFASDIGFGTLLLDASGYQSDYVEACYHLVPGVGLETLKASSPTARNAYHAWPARLVNRWGPGLGFTNLDEPRGELVGVYFVKMGAPPAIQAEQNIKVYAGGNVDTYKCFPLYETRDLLGGGSMLGIAVGPIGTEITS